MRVRAGRPCACGHVFPTRHACVSNPARVTQVREGISIIPQVSACAPRDRVATTCVVALFVVALVVVACSCVAGTQALPLVLAAVLNVHCLKRTFNRVCAQQEPVMFKGTVRSNLDPFGVVDESELWRALELVGTQAHVARSAELMMGFVVCWDRLAGSSVGVAALVRASWRQRCGARGP
jgi:hypothetical protein